MHDLERSPGHRLLEVNQSATELLLKGTVADGLSDWDHGRPQPMRFIDFEHPENNDFLVINQFKVELTSGRGHVIPDAVLFVNGRESLSTSHRARMSLLGEQLEQANDEKIRRMRQSQIAAAEADYARRIQELDIAMERADITADPVAYGVLRVDGIDEYGK